MRCYRAPPPLPLATAWIVTTLPSMSQGALHAQTIAPAQQIAARTHICLASYRSFESAARGLRFHDVEDAPANEQARRELFTSQCVTLAALSAEASERRREVEADVGPTLGLTKEEL